MAIGAVLAPLTMTLGMMGMVPPSLRKMTYTLNRLNPNMARDPTTCIQTKLRGEMGDEVFHYL
ncbi:unnamed protein product, partial [marine sediment metagenome]